MWQTIVMVAAVFLAIGGITRMLIKLIGAIIDRQKVNLIAQIIIISISISYLIWYCN